MKKGEKKTKEFHIQDKKVSLTCLDSQSTTIRAVEVVDIIQQDDLHGGYGYPKGDTRIQGHHEGCAQDSDTASGEFLEIPAKFSCSTI